MTEIKMEDKVEENVEVVDATKGSARPRDPELDSLMKYLSEISETLKAEEDEEIKENLLSTAIRELSGQMKGLVKWRTLSFIVERLLNEANLDTLTMFFNELAKDKGFLF
jgi:hypothetical protein